jgi:predicted nucleic acid-binding protein
MTGWIDMDRLLDTWAWIEFYQGSKIGEEIYSMIESDQTVYTSTITLAELADNYYRENLVTDHSWGEIERFIKSKSVILEPDTDMCASAGEIKKKQRESFPDFGLMDAIILATARKHELDLLTGDPHLTGKESAENLKSL